MGEWHERGRGATAAVNKIFNPPNQQYPAGETILRTFDVPGDTAFFIMWCELPVQVGDVHPRIRFTDSRGGSTSFDNANLLNPLTEDANENWDKVNVLNTDGSVIVKVELAANNVGAAQTVNLGDFFFNGFLVPRGRVESPTLV